MAERPDNRSLGDLLAELSRETATLVRKEFELATTETTRKVKADMSETMEAIQDKLRSRTIVAETAENVRNAARERVNDMAQSASETVGQVVSQSRDAAGELVEGARQNPIPAVMIGVGTAWLLFNSQ